MAKIVNEIMNTEVFALRPEEQAREALHYILALGITGAPVTDRHRKVLGHVSFRDLLRGDERATVEDCMTTPAAVVAPKATLDEAGRTMAKLRVHRLIVVDEQSCVVGVVSALDVVAALVGMPEVHPAAFPHLDPVTGVTWTDQIELSLDGSASAPAGPGVFMLIETIPGKPDRIAWVEGTSHVRSRIGHLLSAPQDDALLAHLLEHPGRLRFRAAPISRENERRQVIDQLRTGLARLHGSLFGCETEATVGRPFPHRPD